MTFFANVWMNFYLTISSLQSFTDVLKKTRKNLICQTMTMAFARPIPNEPWKYGSQRFLDMAKELNAKGMDYSILKQMAGDTFTIVEKMM